MDRPRHSHSGLHRQQQVLPHHPVLADLQHRSLKQQVDLAAGLGQHLWRHPQAEVSQVGRSRWDLHRLLH
ncbi:hypothetical protein [Mycolicibacterium smegmatis]|uniref:hypothetical protein n=1 Tax=Mycolicibacterium smegmatis TaxID=1772 RepID=UPI001CBC17A7|nr:hypothetical protein [Mycolicibacterium smegmatis]UAK52413.1 hypothetical protein K8P01_17195 [Mycolicibacterium smegmatis]